LNQSRQTTYQSTRLDELYRLGLGFEGLEQTTKPLKSINILFGIFSILFGIFSNLFGKLNIILLLSTCFAQFAILITFPQRGQIVGTGFCLLLLRWEEAFKAAEHRSLPVNLMRFVGAAFVDR
jgi:hypothetical protein